MTRQRKWIARARGKRKCSLCRGSVAVEAALDAFWADCGLSDGAKALLPYLISSAVSDGSPWPPRPPAVGPLAAHVLAGI